MRFEGVDDMEYVEELGLDPALAYTPEINEAIIKTIEANNYVEYLAEGIDPDKARAMAADLAEEARANVAHGQKVLAKEGL